MTTSTFSPISGDAVASPVVPTSHASQPGAVRVLHVINGEHYSGAERVQDLLALRLPENRFDVSFACVKPDRFPEFRTSVNAPLFQTPMRSRLDFGPADELAELVRREGFQLLHAHTPRTALLAALAARRAGVPLVYHVHSPTSRDSTRRLQNWLNQLVERWSLRRATKLITVSESLAGHMQKSGVKPDRIQVVPNGVPCLESPPERKPPSTTWTLGTVALFRPRKGTEVLLDAISILRHLGHDVRLRAIGPFETPDYEQQLKRQTAQLDLESVVQWTGFSRDVNTELEQVDLFVLPSLFGEGLPMVVLEAMASGLPVVGTHVEGVPEAIREGQEGTLAAPGDPQALAEAIGRIVTGQLDWSVLSEQALQRQRERFSDESMARGVAEVYRQIL